MHSIFRVSLDRLTVLLLTAVFAVEAAAVDDPAVTGHAIVSAFADFPVVDEHPLFEKLQVEAEQVSLWNRIYTIGKSGLMDAIQNGDASFLTGPMRLTGLINDVGLEQVTGAQEVLRTSHHAHLLRSSSEVGGITVTTDTLVESDGMIRFTINLSADKEFSCKDIAIRLPLKSDLCSYLHYIAETRAKSASLELPAGSGLVWGSREARILYEKEVREHKSDVGGALKNANVKNSFLPMVWVGSGESGLAWFAESDAGWKDAEGRSIVELTRDNDTLEMCVNVIMGHASRKQLTIDFGIQATPVKPLPPRWRTWQHYNARGLHQGRQIEKNQQEYDEKIVADFGDVLMFDLDLIGLDTPNRFSRKITNPDVTREFIQRCRDNNYKAFCYVTPFLLDQDETATDERQNWRRVPYLSRPWNHDGVEKRQDYLCHNSQGNLLQILQTVESLVTEYGLDGVYIDVPFFNGGCMAPGCTHARHDGSLQPIFKIFQMRDFYKKLASIFIRHGKYPYLLIHNSTGTLIPAYSYCWAGKPGEFMADISYSMNHNEYFRSHTAKGVIEMNPHAWGLVTFCMDDIKITRYQVLRPKGGVHRERELRRLL